jgi:hydroxymethylpyrimidine kinase/phosphomethylpyrimidine kinase
MKAVLTIAGVDSGGGAGIAADLRTFAAHELWGTAAVTALTAQNRKGVHRIEAVDPDVVVAQIEAVLDDFDVAAIKTGMIPTAECVDAVLGAVPHGVPLVVDPVFHATTGPRLSDPALKRLTERATVVTPNMAEAAALTGADNPVEAAAHLIRRGAQVVLVTGGASARDVLVTATGPTWLDGAVVDAPNSHGTGCILSAAIAAELALGMDPPDACVAAKAFVSHALAEQFPFFGPLP